jgi:hypothetical protein
VQRLLIEGRARYVGRAGNTPSLRAGGFGFRLSIRRSTRSRARIPLFICLSTRWCGRSTRLSSTGQGW